MSAPPPLRQRNRERTAAEIEAAAFDLFADRGFDAVTVEQIAAAAGVSPRTFFRYFPSKEDVVFGDHAATVARLRAALDDADPASPPLRRVRRAVLAVQAPERDPARERARARLIDESPAVRARASRLIEDLEDAVVDALAATLSPVPAPLPCAHLLAGALFGALRGARRAATADPTAEPGALVAAAFDLVERGAASALTLPADED